MIGFTIIGTDNQHGAEDFIYILQRFRESNATLYQAHQGDYSLSFKLSVVRQIERGEMTYTQAAKHYGIQSNDTVLNWMHKHASDDWHNLGFTLTERAATSAHQSVRNPATCCPAKGTIIRSGG